MTNKVNINKIVWIIVILLIGAVLVFERLKIRNRIENAEFTTGEVIKIDENVKGARYVLYRFIVNRIEYEGSVNIGFCKKCKSDCCKAGSIVRVRYDRNNPKNNDLIP